MRSIEQKEIESISFAVRANVASDLNTFLEVIKAEPAVLTLQDQLHEDPVMIDNLLKVMEHLCNLDFETDYENPADTALTAYGWVLAKVSPSHTRRVSGLLRSLNNAWWSFQLAERLLSKERGSEMREALYLYPLVRRVEQNLSDRVWITVPMAQISNLLSDIAQRDRPSSNFGVAERVTTSLELIHQTVYRKTHSNLGARTERTEFINELTEPKFLTNSSVRFVDFCQNDPFRLRINSDHSDPSNIVRFNPLEHTGT